MNAREETLRAAPQGDVGWASGLARPYGDAVAACGDTSDLQASGAV